LPVPLQVVQLPVEAQTSHFSLCSPIGKEGVSTIKATDSSTGLNRAYNRDVSYQQEIRDVLTSKVGEYNSAAKFNVTIARPGSFEMKVIITKNSAIHEHTFDLSYGLTPRTRKAIQEWADLILAATSNTNEQSPSIA